MCDLQWPCFLLVCCSHVQGLKRTHSIARKKHELSLDVILVSKIPQTSTFSVPVKKMCRNTMSFFSPTTLQTKKELSLLAPRLPLNALFLQLKGTSIWEKGGSFLRGQRKKVPLSLLRGTFAGWKRLPASGLFGLI